MSRIASMMDVGKQSLANSQTALQTVAHNIANRSTEGYTRQRVEQVTNFPLGHGKLRIGTGARAAAVTRTNNPFLEKQIAFENSQLGLTKEHADVMARVEQVFNEQVDKGLNHYMAEFFNAFRELANSPENLATRTLVRDTAVALSENFNKVRSQLESVQKDIDQQMAKHVAEINEYTHEIAELNEKIVQVEIQGGNANDERDRRDLLVKKLGKKIDIRVAEGDDGKIAILAGGAALLVSGLKSGELQAAGTPESGPKKEGNFDLLYVRREDARPVVLTEQVKSGAIGGLVAMRDQVINDYIRRLDSMAYSLAQEVNRAHQAGFDRYNQKNNLFFEALPDVDKAGQYLKVSEAVENDVGRIATAAVPGAPGDNRIANIIAAVQHKKVFNGTDTIDDVYNNLVGEVGVEARAGNLAFESQSGIVNQLKNIRESISGVSLDEETTKMIEFQKNFDASARLIRTADEMLETVLNLKRY